MTVRVIGKVKRLWGGWMRKDRIKVDEKELKGFVQVVRRNGTFIETTHFGGKYVQGANLDWLLLRNRNGLNKPVDYVPPIECKAA